MQEALDSLNWHQLPGSKKKLIALEIATRILFENLASLKPTFGTQQTSNPSGRARQDAKEQLPQPRNI